MGFPYKPLYFFNQFGVDDGGHKGTFCAEPYSIFGKRPEVKVSTSRVVSNPNQSRVMSNPNIA